MIDLKLDLSNAKVIVGIDGNLFTEYRYSHAVCRPFFFPVQTADGQRLTRAYPMEIVAGEDHDHYHHRGICVAHGLVNGEDLWTEETNHGVMLQRSAPAVEVVGDIGIISGIVDWFGPAAQPLLEEQRTIRIQADGANRIMDHCSEFRAVHGDVTFGDTKEGGLISIRVPTTMNASAAGRIENSAGQIYENGKGEEVTWGQRAAWVDYSGPLVSGEEWGFTVVDHCGNPRHPTHWHVRGYGLFTANPFGIHDFKGDKSIDKSMTIAGGDTAVFRYRLIIHPGRGLTGSRIRELIDAFQAQ